MPLHLGQTAPDFEQDTANGSIRFHQWLQGSWCLLFSHPKDFPRVCTSELDRAAALKPEWDSRGVKIIALSVDSSDGHARWEENSATRHGTALNFPVIADADRTVARLYGMVPRGVDAQPGVRSVIVIDHRRKIRLIRTCPPETGCDFDELLRLIDRLQLIDAHDVTLPANWKEDAPAGAPGEAGGLW